MSNGQASLAGYNAGRSFHLVRDCEVARLVVLDENLTLKIAGARD